MLKQSFATMTLAYSSSMDDLGSQYKVQSVRDNGGVRSPSNCSRRRAEPRLYIDAAAIYNVNERHTP